MKPRTKEAPEGVIVPDRLYSFQAIERLMGIGKTLLYFIVANGKPGQ